MHVAFGSPMQCSLFLCSIACAAIFRVSGRIVLTMAIGTAALASPSWTEVMGEDDKMLSGFGRQAAVGGGRLEVANVIVMT